MIEDFTKVKMVEMPRNIVAGHGVLECVRDMCEGIHTGRVGTIVTGTRTMDAAAKAVLGYMDGYDMDVVQVGEATIDNARLVECYRYLGYYYLLQMEKDPAAKETSTSFWNKILAIDPNNEIAKQALTLTTK